MWLVKKKSLCLGIIYTVFIITHNLAQNQAISISFEEAICIALHNNFDILIAKNTQKGSLLSNKLSTLHIWLPKATFMASQENKWEKQGNSFYFRSEPIFSLTWDLQSISEKIFQTKINGQHNLLNNLIDTKNIANTLEKVVTAYYELALAQKKLELATTFVQIAASRLEIEKKKFNLGFVPKINYLHADLAVKEANLSLLEAQETLKEKRCHLNLMLGRPLNQEILVSSKIPVEPIWDINTVTKNKVIDLESAIQEQKVAIADTELTRAKAYVFSCLSLSTGLLSNGYAYNLKDKVWSNSPSSQFIKLWVSIDVGSLLFMPATIKKARMGLDKEKLKMSEEKLSTEGTLENKQWLYRHALGLHRIAQERLKISHQKLSCVKEAYALDQVKLLEWQEAEEDVQKAEINLIAYAFKVKQAEFALYRLVGMFNQ